MTDYLIDIRYLPLVGLAVGIMMNQIILCVDLLMDHSYYLI